MTRRFLASAAALLLLVLAATACGGEDATSVGPSPTETETTETSPGTENPPTDTETTPTETAPATPVTFQVWFAKPDLDERLNGGGDPKLFAVQRSAQTVAVGRAALEELISGPEGADGEGVSSAVPAGTRLLGLNIEDGLATVDLSSEFESGGGSLSMQMRLAQVVFTLTQFPTVDRVEFRLDGEPVDVFSGEGIVLDGPVDRGDYADLMPAIVVDRPTPGAQISSPVTVSGSANVFEANVTVRILDASGKELKRTFTTATCGSGCRGDFSVAVPFPAPPSGSEGFVVVEDDDAAGMGFPPHQVRIPVVFG
jgi:spore germination protein GerM